MLFSTYADLNIKMIEHFQNGEFQQAFDLINQVGSQFPANRPMVEYWKMLAAARLGDRIQIVEIAQKCLKDGLWFGEMMWRMSPSFKSLQGDSAFEQIVLDSLQAQKLDSLSAATVTLKYLPENHSVRSPLVIALHGNQNTAVGTLPFWQPAVAEGCILAVPQSSQAMFKGAYMWNDEETSFADVKKCFQDLNNEILFDSERVILAGHSMGGLIAIQMALTGALNVRGFVVNGPALPFEDARDEFEKLLPPARERGLRAYFIVGEKDVDIAPDEIKVFAEKLRSAGIACELEIIPNATHDYNPHYDAALVRALKFINT